MATEYCRKSGQIPAFGDWENANELPLTQYFECARQAGLLRCSCSGECGGGDLFGVGFEKPLPPRIYEVPQQRKMRETNKGCSNVKEQRKQVKVRDIMEQPRNQALAQKHYSKNSKKSGTFISQQSNVKPVDEDLYKIPSELLENSKRVSPHLI
ncbi:hypothetical protein DH2020_021734 [Rehmannia glutinosa]|uniref:RIN4 pathogenic type III effector avirulence factor Avr cleavage site domain-containing protein n=1 Tax=Rehmannia glutinosa TaxID=99300 RepID=A0ABR0WF06_REHGL